MSLYQTIQTNRQHALGKNRVKYNLFGVIISEVQRKTTSQDVSDTDVIHIIKKLLESVNETLSVAKTEQPDLEAEKVLLSELLPKQLSNDELFAIMKTAISTDPALAEKKNMFPYLKSNYDGQYNGKDANTLFSKLGE